MGTVQTLALAYPFDPTELPVKGVKLAGTPWSAHVPLFCKHRVNSGLTFRYQVMAKQLHMSQPGGLQGPNCFQSEAPSLASEPLLSSGRSKQGGPLMPAQRNTCQMDLLENPQKSSSDCVAAGAQRPGSCSAHVQLPSTYWHPQASLRICVV